MSVLAKSESDYMKKFRYTVSMAFFCIVFVGAAAYAQNITVANISGAEGDEVTVPLSVTSAPNAVVSFQIDIEFNSEYLKYERISKLDTLVENFTVVNASLVGRNIIRFAGFDAGVGFDTGTSGLLANVVFKVKRGTCDTGKLPSPLILKNSLDAFDGWVLGFGKFSCKGKPCIPQNCDDGNLCTADRCDSARGCVNTENIYIVTVMPGRGGDISPTSAAVGCRGSQIFTISPDANYVIEDVKLNGSSVGKVKEYLLDNILSNYVVEAVFKRKAAPKKVKVAKNIVPSKKLKQVKKAKRTEAKLTPKMPKLKSKHKAALDKKILKKAHKPNLKKETEKKAVKQKTPLKVDEPKITKEVREEAQVQKTTPQLDEPKITKEVREKAQVQKSIPQIDEPKITEVGEETQVQEAEIEKERGKKTIKESGTSKNNSFMPSKPLDKAWYEDMRIIAAAVVGLLFGIIIFIWVLKLVFGSKGKE